VVESFGFQIFRNNIIGIAGCNKMFCRKTSEMSQNSGTDISEISAGNTDYRSFFLVAAIVLMPVSNKSAEEAIWQY
jgi:hypothetical protein